MLFLEHMRCPIHAFLGFGGLLQHTEKLWIKHIFVQENNEKKMKNTFVQENNINDKNMKNIYC